ncbi:ATP-dependent Clp endopeptidase, proteolytic subunit ClpP [Batrachochytrium salamandrivorans]|nr:ATP-dependent Clp endopeptidase, proteolytic subunit ClpP [Batrachochytrium salamandrivorans]
MLRNLLAGRRTYVPYVVKRSAQGGERVMDIYSRMLEERIVMIGGEVEEDTSAIVCQLLYLEAENPEKPIHLYINSPGGSVTGGLAIYDTIRFIKPEVHTLVVGQACSMGSLLLACGHKRTALPNARIMVHQPSGGVRGTAENMLLHTNEIIRVRARVNAIFAEHCNKPLAEIEDAMSRDHFMDAKEALKFGIIDEIVTRRG